MSIGKLVKIILGGIIGIAFLFFLVLIIHIAVMVRDRPPIANATIEMARVDFNAPVDSSSIIAIQEKVKQLKGVRSTYYNYKNRILIYTFDNRVNNAQKIYDNAIRSSQFPSKRIIVSAAEAKQGCPVIDNKSFYGKLTALVAKVVN